MEPACSAPRDPPIRLGLVEDSAGFLLILRQIIASTPDLQCCGCWPTLAQARVGLTRMPVDVVLLDMSLPDGSGVDLLRDLVPRCPETDFVVLTVFEDDETIRQAIEAGASGYLLKRSGTGGIIQAVRTVRSGGSPLDADVARRLLALVRQNPPEGHSLAELSPQENNLLREISEGASVKQAAAAIGVTYATARTYLRTIYGKLGVQNQVQAVRRFYSLQRAGR